MKSRTHRKEHRGRKCAMRLDHSTHTSIVGSQDHIRPHEVDKAIGCGKRLFEAGTSARKEKRFVCRHWPATDIACREEDGIQKSRVRGFRASGREVNAIEESRDINVEVEVTPKWQQDASAVLRDLSQRRISMTVLRNVIPTEGLSSLEAPHQWRQRSEVLLRW